MLEIAEAILKLEGHLRELPPENPWHGRRFSEETFLQLATREGWRRMPFRDHLTLGYDERELWSFVVRVTQGIPSGTTGKPV